MTTKIIAPDVVLGKNVVLNEFVNLYGCQIGDETKIGPFVEIQKNALIGKRCKISSHTFICEGVTIEDEVFVGHGVMFINDKYPGSVSDSGELQTEEDWEVIPTLVKKEDDSKISTVQYLNYTQMALLKNTPFFISRKVVLRGLLLLSLKLDSAYSVKD